jgi:hypothetical protein
MTSQSAATTDAEPYQVVSTFEGEIRELLRKESSARSGKPDAAPEQGPDSLTLLLANVAGHSIKEIDGLISELQEVRDFLQAESDRVQKEVAKFAEMSTRALEGVKSVNGLIEPWKGASANQTR